MRRMLRLKLSTRHADGDRTGENAVWSSGYQVPGGASLQARIHVHVEATGCCDAFHIEDS
jgi:hypothetical protein